MRSPDPYDQVFVYSSPQAQGAMSGRDVPLLAPEEAAACAGGGPPFQGSFGARHFLGWVHPLLQRCDGLACGRREASSGWAVYNSQNALKHLEYLAKRSETPYVLP